MSAPATVEMSDTNNESLPEAFEEKWRKMQNERLLKRRKEDKLPRVRNGGSNTPWTLADAVKLCSLCEFRDKNGAYPYPVDSVEQIAHWKKQSRNKITPNVRTLLMNIVGCKHGTKELSPTINYMQNNGKTADVATKRKREGHHALSQLHMGHDQTHAVEGVAIYLFLRFLQLSTSFFNWEAMPVFDGNEADFIMRKKDWPTDMYVPLQMKSASNCIPGKPASYKLRKSDYPNVFCVCVGLQGYVHRTDDVTGPNDTANAPGCLIGEIWNIGSCKIIKTSFCPSFGTPYSKIPADRRLHFPGATDEAKQAFADIVLRDIEAWPRMARSRIFYEISSDINSHATAKYQIEKAGFEAVDAALRAHGLCVFPVWRQNECVDYAVVSIKTGKHLVFVSGKPGKVNNGKVTQRVFDLSSAPKKRFCDVVIASYSGAPNKVAVMSRDTVYVEGIASFSWNETSLKPGVIVFDDIRKPDVGKMFAEYLQDFADKAAVAATAAQCL